MNKIKRIHKVPFREVYCDNFKSFVKSSIWCLFVIKIFPKAHNFETDALKDYYKENKINMYEQLNFYLK